MIDIFKVKCVKESLIEFLCQRNCLGKLKISVCGIVSAWIGVVGGIFIQQTICEWSENILACFTRNYATLNVFNSREDPQI